MPELAERLTYTQVIHATRFYDLVPRWVDTDQTLRALHTQMPGFQMEATLLKVAAIDRLYSTKLYQVYPMARYITEVMAGDIELGKPVELVERLARLDKLYTSFASKFAHFFISAEHFPIYDKFAASSLKYHLGTRNMVLENEGPYRAFVRKLNYLKREADLGCTYAELDHYLYLHGCYLAWKRDPAAHISAEALSLFTDHPDEIRGVFDQ